jgi:uncharacterized protein YwqG
MAADRRDFFKELLKEVAGVAQELQAFRIAEALATDPEPDLSTITPPLRASPARPAPEWRLVEVCQELELVARADDLRCLARTSVRLTAGTQDDAAGSRLGGSPDLPPDFEWPTYGGRELDFVGQVNLERVASLVPDSPLPRHGLLLFFYDMLRKPSGVAPWHRGSCRVVHVADLASLRGDEARSPEFPELPLMLSAELTLPNAWSIRTQNLELTPDETAAWDDVRARLAAAQGVELEERTPDCYSLHRLLGYHEEIGREVELDCELAAAGIDAEDTEVYFAAREEHDARALDWCVLLQVSTDNQAKIAWRGCFGRLYICIREDDLRAGDFGSAWAILQ